MRLQQWRELFWRGHVRPTEPDAAAGEAEVPVAFQQVPVAGPDMGESSGSGRNQVNRVAGTNKYGAGQRPKVSCTSHNNRSVGRIRLHASLSAPVRRWNSRRFTLLSLVV